MNSLNIDYLDDLIESGKISDNIKNICEIFLSAINDWPYPSDSLDEYEIQVYNFIGKTVTKLNIELKISQINYSSHAWQGESLAQILEVFDFYEDKITLKEIIVDLKKMIALINEA